MKEMIAKIELYSFGFSESMLMKLQIWTLYAEGNHSAYFILKLKMI